MVNKSATNSPYLSRITLSPSGGGGGGGSTGWQEVTFADGTAVAQGY